MALSSGFSDPAASVFRTSYTNPATVTVTAAPPPITSRPEVRLFDIYTAPSSCREIITFDGRNFWQYGQGQKGDPNCYPPNFASIFNSFYTPGICPESWTSAGTLAPFPAFDAMCCPMSFFLSSGIGPKGFTSYNCASPITSDLTNVFSTSIHSLGPLPSDAYARTTSIALTDMTTKTVRADVIHVQWANSNTRVVSSWAAMRSSLQAAEVSATATTTGRGGRGEGGARGTSKRNHGDSPHSSFASPSGGLSTGAQIGVGIAIPLIVFSLFAVLIFWILRRRKRARDNHVVRKSSTSSQQASELDINGTPQPTGSSPPPHYNNSAAGGGGGRGGGGGLRAGIVAEKTRNDAAVMYSELASPMQMPMRRESELPTGNEDTSRVMELDTGAAMAGDRESRVGEEKAGRSDVEKDSNVPAPPPSQREMR